MSTIARYSKIRRDRNWLEFLAVLDATLLDATHPIVSSSTELGSSKDTTTKIQNAQDLFFDVAKQDGLKDRSGSLALLELEWRVRTHGLSRGLLTTSPACISNLLNFIWQIPLAWLRC